MTPEQRVTSYLAQNQSKLKSATSIDAIVREIRLSVFYGFSSGLTDDQIRQLVVSWAMVNAVNLLIKVNPGAPASTDPAAPHAPTGWPPGGRCPHDAPVLLGPSPHTQGRACVLNQAGMRQQVDQTVQSRSAVVQGARGCPRVQSAPSG